MSALLCCSCRNPQLMVPQCVLGLNSKSAVGLGSSSTEFFGRGLALGGFRFSGAESRWSFVGGSKIAFRQSRICEGSRRGVPSLMASWLTTAQIASNSFTLGTVAVLPFYTLMVLAPNAQITKKTMESGIPYVILGLLYGYLLYLSWSPETLRAMFASKYWLPELAGIAKMFTNELTVASAWIHLLAVDLFAARQVYQDGLQSNVETRHSVSLCLLFCPLGVLVHFVTKLLTRTAT